MSANAIQLAFQKACRKAGIEDLHFHDLRYEATSPLQSDMTRTPAPKPRNQGSTAEHRELRSCAYLHDQHRIGLRLPL